MFSNKWEDSRSVRLRHKDGWKSDQNVSSQVQSSGWQQRVQVLFSAAVGGHAGTAAIYLTTISKQQEVSESSARACVGGHEKRKGGGESKGEGSSSHRRVLGAGLARNFYLKTG